MTIAVATVGIGERLLRRFRRPGAQPLAIDYRFAALGSQVPDAIDKPLKYHLFPDSLPDSHIYGHTLLLSGCIILAGLVFARRGDSRLLVLGLGSFTHPLVDPTNTYPETLFWPLFGTDFPVSSQPWRQYVQPPLDALLVAVYAIAIWRSAKWRERALAFVRTGAFPFASPHDEAASHKRA